MLKFREQTIYTPEERKALLINQIETGMELDEKEQAQFEQFLDTAEGVEISEMITLYELRGRREMLKRMLLFKFGALPDSVVKNLETVDDPADLDALAKRLLKANALEETGLTQPQ